MGIAARTDRRRAIAIALFSLTACAPAVRTSSLGPTPGVTTNGGPAADPTRAMDAAATSGAAVTDASHATSSDLASSNVATAPRRLLPNLTIDGNRIRRSAFFEVREFGRNACDLQEGCLAGPGRRRLLRFDLETPNDGEGDAVIGHPTRDDPRFEWSTCHGHRHFLGYARFGLFAANGSEIAHGHKQSFCLMDSNRTGRVPSRARSHYTCDGEQGIQAGWSDVYERNLDCQYVDVTGVPAGTYQLRVSVNVNRGIEESRYDDNDVAVEITVPPSGRGEVIAVADAGAPGDVLRACTIPTTGVDRDCGWTRMGTHECTPGQRMQVACNAACGAGYGACTGDAMLRVCEGVNACDHVAMLGQNDDGCPQVRGTTTCPAVSFTCPANGRFTVLTGSYASGLASTCTIGFQPIPPSP